MGDSFEFFEYFITAHLILQQVKKIYVLFHHAMEKVVATPQGGRPCKTLVHSFNMRMVSSAFECNDTDAFSEEQQFFFIHT